MNMPFYVAPEQLMKDRADFAQKGIARGRSLVAVEFDGGVLLCAAPGLRQCQPHALAVRAVAVHVMPRQRTVVISHPHRWGFDNLGRAYGPALRLASRAAGTAATKQLCLGLANHRQRLRNDQ